VNCPFVRKLVFVVAVSVITASCSIGDSDSVASGGIGGTGISVGTITDFGSIFVNDVEFETTGATIILNGSPATENDLERGMVAAVLGDISGDTGSAASVMVEDVLKGPVENVVTDGANVIALITLDQTVQINELTNFDNNVVPVAGDLLEVHGLIKGNGVIEGAFIAVRTALAEFRVKGFVENVTATTFNIGALMVDYTSAALPAGVPSEGQLVEVKGDNILGPSDELIATRVEPEVFDVGNANHVEIEGFITAVTPPVPPATVPSEFTLTNQLVQTSLSTIFEAGTADELVVGVKVEVEGAGNPLLAEKVKFKDPVMLEADVASKADQPPLLLTLKGLPGITVRVNGLTEVKGKATSFIDIAVDDHVRIRGRRTGNFVLATRLDERSANTDVVLQGPVDEPPAPPPSDPIVSILGVVVDTSGLPDNDRNNFFATVNPGGLVKAQGTLHGSAVPPTVIWNKIERED